MGFTQLAIVFCGYCKCLFFFLPPPDHKGPKVADHRGRDALNRLVHPHLLADCGSTQKDRGRVQPGGQSAVLSFGLSLFSPSLNVRPMVFMLMTLDWAQLTAIRESRPQVGSLGGRFLRLRLQREHLCRRSLCFESGREVLWPPVLIPWPDVCQLGRLWHPGEACWKGTWHRGGVWEEAKGIWAATPLVKPNLAWSKLGSESSRLLSSRIYIFCLFISSGIKLGSRIGASVYRSQHVCATFWTAAMIPQISAISALLSLFPSPYCRQLCVFKQHGH